MYQVAKGQELWRYSNILIIWLLRSTNHETYHSVQVIFLTVILRVKQVEKKNDKVGDLQYLLYICRFLKSQEVPDQVCNKRIICVVLLPLSSNSSLSQQHFMEASRVILYWRAEWSHFCPSVFECFVNGLLNFCDHGSLSTFSVFFFRYAMVIFSANQR